MSTETQQRPATADQSVPEIARDLADVVKRLVKLEIELIKIQAKDTLRPAAIGIGLALAGLITLLLFAVTYLGVLAQANSLVDDWAAGAAVGSLVLAAAFGGLGARVGRVLMVIAALFGLAAVAFTVTQLVLAIVFEGRRGWAIEASVFYAATLGLLAAGGLLIWRAVRRGKALADGVTALPDVAKETVGRAKHSWRGSGVDS